MKSGSNLEKVFAAGHFAVTSELGPPKGNDVSVIQRKVDFLRGYVDAVNVTDNQTAIVRMSSIATCAFVIQMGMEPVMQMVTRDRNRIAMQSDIFGATALGIRNIVCLTGDHHTFGNQVNAKNVHDLDSVQLDQHGDGRCATKAPSWAARTRSTARLSSLSAGQPTPSATPSNSGPAHGQESGRRRGFYPDPVHLRHGALQGVDADDPRPGGPREGPYHGRCYPPEIRRYGAVHGEKCVGDHHPGGHHRPDGEGRKGADEGIKLCVEQIQELQEIEGVHGIHIMAIEWEQMIAKITEKAGLLPRPHVE